MRQSRYGPSIIDGPAYIDWFVSRFWAGRKMRDGQHAELSILLLSLDLPV